MTFAEQIRKVISYNLETGVFSWLTERTRRPAHKIGDVAGYLCRHGYWEIGVFSRRYYGHRLAFVLVTGRWPVQEIDHINGDPSDNRWVNLREARHAQNIANSKIYKNNTSGFKGVILNKKTGRWYSQIGADQESLGTFDTKEQAYAAYVEAAKSRFGKFMRLS
jgi:hypothetical protein